MTELSVDQLVAIGEATEAKMETDDPTYGCITMLMAANGGQMHESAITAEYDDFHPLLVWAKSLGVPNKILYEGFATDLLERFGG